MLNLISNGFYAATKRKAEAARWLRADADRATTRTSANSVEIRIRDNGTGIPPEVKEKMFNPFFTTKPAGEGTGLGLSMSHDIIVKQHGGTIDVDTEAGRIHGIHHYAAASNIRAKTGTERMNEHATLSSSMTSPMSRACSGSNSGAICARGVS